MIRILKNPYTIVFMWLLFSLVSLGYFGYQDTIFGAVCV